MPGLVHFASSKLNAATPLFTAAIVSVVSFRTIYLIEAIGLGTLSMVGETTSMVLVGVALLVTSGALSAPCPKDCFNWGTQGLPVSPLASSGKTGRVPA